MIKIDKLVLFGLLLLSLCFIGNTSTSSGEQYEDFLKRYSRKSAEIIQLSQSVKEPSDYSKSIQSKLVGHWICVPEISSDMPKIVLKSFTFYENGTVKYSYEVKDENRIIEMTGSYEICHKGSLKHLPGKEPNVIIGSQARDDSLVFPLISVSVGYDNRLSMPPGELLKFSDLDGNQFVFILENETPDRRLLYIDTSYVDTIEKEGYGNRKQERVANATVTKEVLASLRKGKLTEPQKNKAILRLMNEGDSSSVPTLVEHLSNVHSLVVRQNAIGALGNIGDKRAVAPLLKILKEPVKGDTADEGEEEAILRRSAVLALGDIDDASALPVLEAVAQDSKEYQSVRELAAIAVEKIKVSERERGKLRE